MCNCVSSTTFYLMVMHCTELINQKNENHVFFILKKKIFEIRSNPCNSQMIYHMPDTYFFNVLFKKKKLFSAFVSPKLRRAIRKRHSVVQLYEPLRDVLKT